jgi:flagellum-specific peptidoglycan hydrolase FlgJ
MKKLLLIVSFTVLCTLSLSAQKNKMTDSVWSYICALQIKHPEIVIRQAILESGWFKSPFLMSRNNLFGFRKVKYLQFKNWKESVEYYKKWQDKYYTNPKEDYYKFLLRIKYATSVYPAHLKKISWSKTCSL